MIMLRQHGGYGAGGRHRAGDPGGQAAGHPDAEDADRPRLGRGQKPVAAAGLKVNAFATGLKHPRWMHVLPNGDVLAAEALTLPGGRSRLRLRHGQPPCGAPRRSARARTGSPCCATPTATASPRSARPSSTGLNQPFGMALVGDTFYVGNTDGVVAFPYAAGATRIAAPGRQARRLQARRPLDAQPAAEPRRHEALRRRRLAQQHRRERHGGRGGPRRDLRDRPRERQAARIFASGLRNPVGLAWEPATRRALDRGQRARRPRRRDPARLPDLGSATAASTAGPTATGAGPSTTGCRRTRPRSRRRSRPDYALGGHTASLGLCWLPAGTLPGFPDGMAIGQHGSWNRSTLSGYRVVFVPFADGAPPARRATS